MGYPLRIEGKDKIFFLTNRTIASRLWFMNNKSLENDILSYLARYQEMYEVLIYGFILMGNHYHLIAQFPKCNKAAFMKAFNGMISRLVSSHVSSFDQGKLWARRYSEQVLPNEKDVEHWWLYAALNPEKAGLSMSGYNSYKDAVSNRKRVYTVFEKSEYDKARFIDPQVKRADYTKEYKLTFSRLPGYEQLSQREYESSIEESYRERRQEVIAERKAQGKGFVPKHVLLKQKPGAKPRTTKKSKRFSKRPLVLTLCYKTKKRFLETYFKVLDQFIEASEQFRQGVLSIEFPKGTYRPYVFCT